MNPIAARILPKRWPSAFRALTVLHDTNGALTDPADNPLTAAQKVMLDKTNEASLISRVFAAEADIRAALAQQGQVTVKLKRLTERLRSYAADYHTVLDLAIRRGDIPSGRGARAYYGRDTDRAVLPKMKSHDDLETVATKIVEGEPRRLAAEGANAVPMTLPSAAKVEALRDEFHAQRLLSLAAKRRTNDAQEARAALWKETIAAITDMWDTIEFHHRHDPDRSSFRAKCAAWGVAYAYGKSKSATATPTPPPPSSPQPPSVSP